MHLPHLAKQESNRKWLADERAALYKVLYEAVGFAGPEYVLDVLADVRRDWGKATFETAKLQKEAILHAIEIAAEVCREITQARFDIEAEHGINPLNSMLLKTLESYR
jgi:hypothetical protein